MIARNSSRRIMPSSPRLWADADPVAFLLMMITLVVALQLQLFVSGFAFKSSSSVHRRLDYCYYTKLMSERNVHQAGDFKRSSTFLDEENSDEYKGMDDKNNQLDINVVFLDEKDFEDEDKKKEQNRQEMAQELRRKRWGKLNSKFKKKNKGLLQDDEEDTASATPKKESPKEKKRRMMMYFKEKQREKKRASRVERPLGFDDRVPLSAYFPGMEMAGVVISLTDFGAYVDVGTECDGLLHISQITRDFFVEHPRQVLSPGDEVTVKVRSASPEMKKLQLTMLDVVPEEQLQEEDDEERIQLMDLEVDDELWGEFKRVTDFGAFVEVGAEVDGFLHFMDHPLWDNNMHPSEFMQIGERVRVWVADIDMEKRRVRLTANRPPGLPGPRFEF
mmetsp:Transcript_25389/g.47305  ORF Transcript_25389/g.47305 Transcript_25389/m.47305 type:complete len:390 (-) Transcript_25389:647-1816(-)